jgi:hypothetical protein
MDPRVKSLYYFFCRQDGICSSSVEAAFPVQMHCNIFRLDMLLCGYYLFANYKKKPPWSESVSELYQPNDRRL